jgi:hypothetical protein
MLELDIVANNIFSIFIHPSDGFEATSLVHCSTDSLIIIMNHLYPTSPNRLNSESKIPNIHIIYLLLKFTVRIFFLIKTKVLLTLA